MKTEKTKDPLAQQLGKRGGLKNTTAQREARLANIKNYWQQVKLGLKPAPNQKKG